MLVENGRAWQTWTINELCHVDRLRWIQKHNEEYRKVEIEAQFNPKTPQVEASYTVSARGPVGQVKQFAGFVAGFFDGLRFAKGE